MKCPYCAEEIPHGTVRCPVCGSDLSLPLPGVAAAPPAPTAPALQYTHSGQRYLLGYGPDFFGIWDRASVDLPVERYPRTDGGWADAWRRFVALEPSSVEVGLGGPSLALPAAPPVRPTGPLVRWLIPLLLATVAIGLIGLPSVIRSLHAIADVLRSGTYTAREIQEATRTRFPVSAIQSPLAIATIVVWLVWQHRAQANLRALGVQGLRFTPGWAVGWWFVPFANAVMPYLVIRELWRASDPTAGPSDWRERRTTPLILAWWLAYIGPAAILVPASIVVFATIGDAAGGDPASFARAFDAFATVVTVAVIASAVAAVLAVLLVLDVERRQRAKVAAGERPPVALSS